MSTKVAPLGLRLFMEGIEVPVIAASVTVQPDMPATAAIQVLPTDMGLNFLPRTLVHLFYLDANLTDDEIESAKKVKDKSAQVRTGIHGAAEVDRIETNDFAYKILFTGEVIGYNYKKTPSGRQMVLQCMDLSSYWDTCYQFFSDYSASGNGLTDKTHQFVGAGSGQFDNLGGHQWVIANLLQSRPKSPEYQECEGLLGGLIHLLETVGGLRYRNGDFKGYRGVTDFFTIAELRYGLLSMLGAVSADKTSAKLFAAKAFSAWITNGMTPIGSLVSFRDMLNHVNRHIYHNIYPNPCAMYVPGGETKAKRTVVVGRTMFLDSVQGPAIRGVLVDGQTRLLRAITRLRDDGLVVVEGMSDTFYRITSIDEAWQSVQEILLNEVTPSIAAVDSSHGANASQVSAELREIEGLLKLSSETLSKSGLHTEWFDNSMVVSDIPGAFRTRTVLGVTGGLRKFSNPVRGVYNDQSGRVKGVLDDLTLAYTKLGDLLNKDVARLKPQEFKVPKASFLYNQLFLPEAFFVAPPRCNVIFPDQYFDLNYSRNFMREITRLASTGGLGVLGGGKRGAELFNTAYLAPPIKDVKGKLLLANMSQGSRVLLPHEVHSGIIPKFEWVTDGHRWGVKAQKNDGGKVHYLQRLANFQFFLHRWSARQLAITGIFNPNIVAGLPGVIIDRSAPSPAVTERLEKLLRRRMLPTQFVGKVYGYTHAIGQQGGSTSIQFAYARTHRGLDDEFLGTLSREIAEESAEATFVVNPKELAAGLDSAAVQEEQQKQADEAKATQLGPRPDLVRVGYVKAKEAEAKQKAKQKAKTSASNLTRALVVRMWAEKKLKVGVTVEKLGLLKQVTLGPTGYLTQAEASTLGITDEYFNTNKKTVTVGKGRGVAVPASASARQASARWLGGESSTNSVDVFLKSVSPGKDVVVIAVPEKITLGYVQVYGTGRYERTGQAFEDVARPGWFSADVWSNKKITKAVYEPLLGAKAITDDSGLSQSAQDEMLKRWKTDQTKRISGGGGEGEGTVAVDTTSDSKFTYTVVPGSVEETIDGLSMVYGMIKERGGDLHGFIREFTRRPIANLVDILGTQNLEFNDQGSVADPNTMIEGFHSRAFGDYNTNVQLPEKEGASTKAGIKALHALMDGVADPASLKRPGLIGRDEPPSGLRPELDPRGRARGRVRAYVEELQLSRGLLGS